MAFKGLNRLFEGRYRKFIITQKGREIFGFVELINLNHFGRPGLSIVNMIKSAGIFFIANYTKKKDIIGFCEFRKHHKHCIQYAAKNFNR